MKLASEISEDKESNSFKDLIDKIKNKDAKVGICGLGYVGLPLALRFNECNFKVIGFDIDPAKIESIDSGETYIKHVSSSRILNAVERGFTATTDFSLIESVDAIIICVPTPLGNHRDPDLSFVVDTLNSVAPYMRPGQLFSLESTTYPGTTDEVIVPVIEERGFIIGQDFFVCYSPEREDPGNPLFETSNIPKVVGANTENCLNIACELYSHAVANTVAVSSTKIAEMTKLLENIYRAVNIGLANEMKLVADAMGIDIFQVIEAAASKPFGFTPFYPGPGLGGHCIPIDPFYLTWKAKEFGINTKFIETAGEVNSDMPKWIISKTITALNSIQKSVSASNILVLGVAYKKNIDDMRESPSVEIIQRLLYLGAKVSYSDPHVPCLPRMRRYSLDLISLAIDERILRDFDCVILCTDHDDFDYDVIKNNSQLIIDTRGRYVVSDGDNVIRA